MGKPKSGDVHVHYCPRCGRYVDGCSQHCVFLGEHDGKPLAEGRVCAECKSSHRIGNPTRNLLHLIGETISEDVEAWEWYDNELGVDDIQSITVRRDGQDFLVTVAKKGTHPDDVED